MLFATFAFAVMQQPERSRVNADYLPGPWVVFPLRSDRLPQEAERVIEQVRDMTVRLPAVAVKLCAEGGKPVPQLVVRHHLQLVKRALVNSGVAARRISVGIGCGGIKDATRPPAVTIMPIVLGR